MVDSGMKVIFEMTNVRDACHIPDMDDSAWCARPMRRSANWPGLAPARHRGPTREVELDTPFVEFESGADSTEFCIRVIDIVFWRVSARSRPLMTRSLLWLGSADSGTAGAVGYAGSRVYGLLCGTCRCRTRASVRS